MCPVPERTRTSARRAAARRRLLGSAGAAAGGLACAAGRDAAPAVRSAALPGAPERARARVEGGRVVVEGTYTTGVCHLWVARGARLDGDTLTLWVRERGRDLWWLRLSACPDVAEVHGFRATVTGLAPGTYHVGVDDEPAGGPPMATAAVTVPGEHTGR